MNALLKIIEALSFAFSFLKARSVEKKAEDVVAKQNAETAERDKAETLISQLKNARTQEEKEIIIEQIRKTVSK